MTSWCFRLKFRVVTNVDVPEHCTISVPPLLASAKISSNQPLAPGANQWMAIKATGYESEKAAWSAAMCLKDAILIAGAKGFGADFGTNTAKSRLASFIKDSAKEKFGTIIRDEVHGIDVFEDGDVRHFEASAQASVHMELSHFEKSVAEVAEARLTATSRTGAELLNDSLFNMPDEARFLLRISAIESMCQQGQRPEPVQALIDQLLKAMPSMTADSSAEETMRSVLKDSRRESVRRACLGKIRKMLGDNAAKQFDQLYDLRSKYLHDGRGRGFMAGPAEEARLLAMSLLEAEIASAPDRSNSAC
jgi:hypothetical protein